MTDSFIHSFIHSFTFSFLFILFIGEDRRVKKAFKTGFNSGIYSEWSREVVRAGPEERRNNGRSKCAKLRWAILADGPKTVDSAPIPKE